MNEETSNVLKDFTELHDNMVAELKKRLPQLDTVALYDPTEITHGEKFKIDTPAILIEMVEAKPGDAITGGRQAFDCAFQFYCILSKKTPQLPLAVRNLAAAVSQVVGFGEPTEKEIEHDLIPSQSWGLSKRGVKPVAKDSVAIYPGMFKPGKGGNDKTLGYDSMIVSFEQSIHLGELMLDPKEFLPGEITIGGDFTISHDWEDPTNGAES